MVAMMIVRRIPPDACDAVGQVAAWRREHDNRDIVEIAI